MNTVPLRARKSNDSWSGQSRNGLRPSLRRIQRSERGARRRFIFSVSLFVFTIAGLIVGGAGGFIPEASAQENYRSGYWNQINNRFEWIWSGNSNSRNNQREDARTNVPATQRTTQPTQQTPVTQEQTPAPAPTQPAPAQTTPVPAQTVAPAAPRVIEPEVAAPVVNTAPVIETMASAQAATEAKPVTYTSNQISTESRNRLLALAVSAVTSGSLIFIMSLFGTTGVSPSIARYRKLGREVLAS